MTEVPVIVLDHLSETQKRAYIIADNRLAENAGWDDELLQVELTALQQEDFNVHLLGFDDEDLARLLAGEDVGTGLTDEDAVPETRRYRSRVQAICGSSVTTASFAETPLCEQKWTGSWAMTKEISFSPIRLITCDRIRARGGSSEAVRKGLMENICPSRKLEQPLDGDDEGRCQALTAAGRTIWTSRGKLRIA
jgi:hypothetical protein